jgi:SAM-dependent methyltransferase
MAGSWDDRAYLRGTQYKTDTNLAARQSIYACQQPRLDLAARVLDLAGPAPSDTIADVGCGNGMYLAELTGRGLPGQVLGVDLSLGMLAAARQRLAALTGPWGGARVTLAGGDATALPLRDRAADLTLAAHMLYHVPEPADALRELRRVTRPGGRVVLVLNGAGHLRQLRTAIAVALGDAGAPRGERVTLDDGESMARSLFGQVARHDFTTELRVPAPEPIADYVRSLPGTRPADLTDLAATVAATFRKTPEGHYLISTHTGCLICRVD